MKYARLPSALAALLAVLAASAVSAGESAGSSFDAQLLELQQAWAQVNYDTSADDAREKGFEALMQQAVAFTHQHPGRAEPLIWAGIIESSYAGAKGGLGALSLARKARADLEAAMKLDPTALDGSAFTSLGALYYKVPGFPVGFGSDTKAAELLRQALEINPDGIDPNYFYGEFLYEQGEYAQALRHLEKASKVPGRPGRERADQGRQAEIAALTAKVHAKMT